MAPGCLTVIQKQPSEETMIIIEQYKNQTSELIFSSSENNNSNFIDSNLTPKTRIFQSYYDEINLDEIPLPSYPPPPSSPSTTILSKALFGEIEQDKQKEDEDEDEEEYEDDEIKSNEIETINKTKKSTIKSINNSTNKSIDTIDSFEILEQTIMKQKRLARLKNTDLRKKILLKRTFDLVCEIMDHENGDEEEEEDVLDEDDEDETIKNIDDSDESDSEDEEEEEDEDEDDDDNEEYQEDVVQKSSSILSDQLIPKDQLIIPFDGNNEIDKNNNTNNCDNLNTKTKDLVTLTNQELKVVDQQDDVYHLNILSEDDLVEFNFDFIDTTTNLPNESNNISNINNNVNNNNSYDQVIYDNSIDDHELTTSRSNNDLFKLNANSIFNSNKRRRLSNSDEDEEEEDFDEDEDVENEFNHLSQDQQLITNSYKKSLGSNCYLYNSATNNSLKRQNNNSSSGGSKNNDLESNNKKLKTC